MVCSLPLVCGRHDAGESVCHAYQWGLILNFVGLAPKKRADNAHPFLLIAQLWGGGLNRWRYPVLFPPHRDESPDESD
jgi:hypothetical protein